MSRRIPFLSALAVFVTWACILPFAPETTQPPPAAVTTEASPVPQITAPTLEPSAINEPTPQSTATRPPLPATGVPTPVANESQALVQTVAAGKPYVLQPGSPTWLPNFTHPEAGCNWMGIAGQVFDADNNPVTSLVVEVGGDLEANQILSLSLTGVAPVYGSGGYEVPLSDRPIESSKTLWLQVHDLEGRELTDRIFFDTFADCNRNLILMNFVESPSQVENFEIILLFMFNNSSLQSLNAP
jgi:hypothetical protein